MPEKNLNAETDLVQQLIEISPDILTSSFMEHPVNFERKPISLNGHTTDAIKKGRGKKLKEFFHPDDLSNIRIFSRSIVDTSDEEIREVEFRVRTAAGQWLWLQTRGKLLKDIKDEDGNVEVHLSKMVEQAESKKKVESLVESERLSAIGQFSRALAHEIRNPLTNINLATEILQNELNGKDYNGRFNDSLEIIKRNSARIAMLLKQIVNSQSKSDAPLISTDLAKIMNDTLNAVSDRISLRSISVQKEFTDGFMIHAEVGSLKRALLNLIVNAIEAIEGNEGILKISITRNNANFVLKISDNGCGMTPEELTKIFQPLYSSKPSGLGMGLANVAAIMKKLESRIEVESTPGIGTTFSIFFPVQLRQSSNGV